MSIRSLYFSRIKKNTYHINFWEIVRNNTRTVSSLKGFDAQKESFYLDTRVRPTDGLHVYIRPGLNCPVMRA